MNINELKKEVTLIFPIEIFLCNGKCLIWNKKIIHELRKKYRIVGTFIGNNSEFSSYQNKYKDVPLLLMNEEVTLLLKNNIIKIIDHTNKFLSINWLYPSTLEEKYKYNIFEDLWLKGYFITNGSKFGGDFLIYRGDPINYHASFIIIIKLNNQTISPLDIISYCRLGMSVKKITVIASILNNKIHYFSIYWKKLTREKIINKAIYI